MSRRAVVAVLACVIAMSMLASHSALAKPTKAQQAREAWNAARYGQVERLQKLLEQRPDLLNTQESGSGQTLLMAATLAGKPEVVKHLLLAGADATIGEMQGYTAFHGAGFQGRPAVAKVLIDAGLDPQHEHADGYQAIHRACWGSEPRHAEVVRVLVEDGGVPYDVKDRHGETPLTHARRRNNPSTVQLLEDYAAADKQQAGSEL